MTVSVQTDAVGRDALRPHAEHTFAAELAALAAADDRPRPARWKLSPWAVSTYLLGVRPQGVAADCVGLYGHGHGSPSGSVSRCGFHRAPCH